MFEHANELNIYCSFIKVARLRQNFTRPVGPLIL